MLLAYIEKHKNIYPVFNFIFLNNLKNIFILKTSYFTF